MGILDGKVALITGGTSGVGRAAATMFAAEGAKLVIVGRRADVGAEVVRELQAEGAEAIFVPTDISVESDAAAMAAAAKAAYGRVDVAFLNAGVGGSGVRIENMTIEDFSSSIAMNLTGAFLCLKHLIPVLTAPGASVMFTSSVVSLQGSPGRAAYTAAKGGLNSFARAAAMELAPRGIRVNVVCPAGILTPMAEAYLERNAERFGGKEAAFAAAHGLHPIGRMANPEDVAATALYLASPAAAMITGQIISVDGGLSAGSVAGV